MLHLMAVDQRRHRVASTVATNAIIAWEFVDNHVEPTRVVAINPNTHRVGFPFVSPKKFDLS